MFEGEAAATGKGSSEEEGSKELENKATLTTIVSTLENISRKFDQIDSRFNAYELDRIRPLMDQKTIDDMVKALVEERLKVLGKNILAKELDKDIGVKRTLAEEFGSVAKATDLDSHLDFVYISHAKATKDDKDAKVPPYGRGCMGRRTVKDEDAADKKKAVQAEATLKRKEKADGKRKEAGLKKCMVEKSGEESDFSVVNDEVLAEENELAPKSDVENQEVVKSAVLCGGNTRHRTRTRKRSHCSDRTRVPLGRYVATELEPKLGRYVATELEPKLGRYVATERPSRSVAT
ncbi:hypothetical protein DY000_02021496 [Brassica cretica]|uniref:Uncharacterized protein n=1 Tax=Brassica cretica TaxID=69181 RepID=A0ABQ7E4Q5_BRACR|nr:hypothetical protein DY000_02021496 [Brassica cretica]